MPGWQAETIASYHIVEYFVEDSGTLGLGEPRKFCTDLSKQNLVNLDALTGLYTLTMGTHFKIVHILKSESITADRFPP